MVPISKRFFVTYVVGDEKTVHTHNAFHPLFQFQRCDKMSKGVKTKCFTRIPGVRISTPLVRSTFKTRSYSFIQSYTIHQLNIRFLYSFLSIQNNLEGDGIWLKK